MKKVEVRDLNFNLGDIVRLKFIDDNDFFIGEVICVREFEKKSLQKLYYKTLIKLNDDKKTKSKNVFIAKDIGNVIVTSLISKLDLNYSSERDDGSICTWVNDGIESIEVIIPHLLNEFVNNINKELNSK